MTRIILRFFLLATAGLVASCGPTLKHDFSSPTAACGSPDITHFHGVHTVMVSRAPLPKEIVLNAPDGCAIISFSLATNGTIVDPAVVIERPSGLGIGEIATTILSRDIYAPNSENGFDTMAPVGPDQRYAITIGIGHADGRLIIARRTVRKHQTIRVDH
jgi:hypothetical protein